MKPFIPFALLFVSFYSLPVLADEEPTPSPTATASATPTITPENTPSPTVTAVTTITPTATVTVTATITPTTTATPTATRTPPTKYTQLDFDGDGFSDLATFENQNDGSPNELVFRYWSLVNYSAARIEYGNSADHAVPGDYNGDGVWDYAYVRENPDASLTWHVQNGLTGQRTEFSFGQTKNLIVGGCDFFGTYQTSPAVVQDQTLNILNLTTNQTSLVALPVSTSQRIRQVYCVDLNGDKQQEMILLIEDKPSVSSKATKRKSTLLAMTLQGVVLNQYSGYNFDQVTAADINGDGLNELIHLQTVSGSTSKLVYHLPSGEVSQTVKSVTDMVAGSYQAGHDLLYLWQKSYAKYTFPEQTMEQVTSYAGTSFLQPVSFYYTGGLSPEDPLGLCSAILPAHDGPNGFLWKASDVHGGTLAVVFPRTYKKFKSVSVMKDGITYSTLRFSGIANGNRQHWRSSKKASSFPNRSLVVAKRKETICWQIGQSNKRND